MSENEQNVEAVSAETLDEREQQLLMLHGDVFHQLLQHPRFKLFLNANYDIRFRSDPDSKEAGFVVMEIPHAMVAERIRNMLEEQQEQDPKIVIADASALDKLK